MEGSIVLAKTAGASDGASEVISYQEGASGIAQLYIVHQLGLERVRISHSARQGLFRYRLREKSSKPEMPVMIRIMAQYCGKRGSAGRQSYRSDENLWTGFGAIITLTQLGCRVWLARPAASDAKIRPRAFRKWPCSMMETSTRPRALMISTKLLQLRHPWQTSPESSLHR